MRDIDDIIEFIKKDNRFSPVHTQVLINRISPPPTRAELDEARQQVDLGQEKLDVG